MSTEQIGIIKKASTGVVLVVLAVILYWGAVLAWPTSASADTLSIRGAFETANSQIMALFLDSTAAPAASGEDSAQTAVPVVVSNVDYSSVAPASSTLGLGAVTGVMLDQGTISMETGQSAALTATVEPTDADNAAVAWSCSNYGVATVDAEGNVTALSPGAADIVVTTLDGGFTATCSVTVASPVIVPLAPSITTTACADGTESVFYLQTLSATGDAPVTWSLASGDLPQGLALADDGDISGTPLVSGDFNFKVTATNAAGSDTQGLTIHVNTTPAQIIYVQGISLDKKKLTLEPGSTATLTATVSPADATSQAVIWSVDNQTLVTVDGDGRVSAATGFSGTATVTATSVDGGWAAICVITVPSPAPTTVTDPAPTTVTDPAPTTVQAPAPTSSLAPAPVTSPGSAPVSAPAPSPDQLVAPLATVSPAAAPEPVPVTGLKLNKADLELSVGQTTTLKATVSPADATEQGIVWASTDKDIAAVGPDGTVTATGAGTATVTATTVDGGWAEACEVTVAEGIIRVADITLDQSALSLAIGQSVTLTATVYPSNAQYREVFWDSDNPYVATVDQDGVVTAHGTGTATITVSTEDSEENGHNAICEVTVAAPATDSSNVAGVTMVTTPKTADGSLGSWAIVLDLLAVGMIGLCAWGVRRALRRQNLRGDKPGQ